MVRRHANCCIAAMLFSIALAGCGTTLTPAGEKVLFAGDDSLLISGMRLLCNGTAGGVDAREQQDGTTIRSYALIDLEDDGQIRVRRRSHSGAELDRLAGSGGK